MTASPPDSPDAWPSEWSDALGDAALRRAAGPAAFDQGRDHAARGAVEVLDEDPLPEPALRAQVLDDEEGSCDAEVWIEDDAVAGRCGCDDAREGRFCAHQVAVAMLWRERRDTGVTGRNVGHRPVVPDDEDDADAAALRAFLRRQPASVLADKLMDLAAFDNTLARRLQRWRGLSEAGSDPEHVRRLIDEMLPLDAGSRDWDGEWGDGVDGEGLLSALRQARARDALSALDLSHHALRRAWAWQQLGLDDGEESGELCEMLGDEWLESLRAAGPQPAAFGEVYLDLLLDDQMGSFDPAAAEAAMGSAALARFRQVLERRWRAAKEACRARAPAPTGFSHSNVTETGLRASVRNLDLVTLERLHLEQLEAVGEFDAALELLREGLRNAYAYRRLIEFLERQGRHAEALSEAQAAHRQFPDDRQLQDALLRGYEHAGHRPEALALRRLQFEQRPTVHGFQMVLEAAAAAGEDVAACRSGLFALIEVQEREQAARPRTTYACVPPGVRDVTLRADILAAEGRWSEACALVQPPAWCEARTLRAIALHLGPDQRADAVRLLQRLLEVAMARAGSPYEQELALVEEAARRMDAAPRAAWLAELRQRYKPKRNFIKGLPAG